MTMLQLFNKRWAWFFLFSIFTQPLSAKEADAQYWPVIHQAFFSGKTIHDGAQLIHIDAPQMAEDAAIVPLAFSVDATAITEHKLHKVYLFVDANPIQHTATIQYLQNQPINVATRIKLDKSSMVRVIVESVDGQYWMHQVFIKTPGGGCSGGLGGNEAKIRAEAGKMKLAISPISGDGAATHQMRLHIKHPMRTGFERTTQGYYAKAYYIKQLDFSMDNAALFRVDLGVGISADPYFAMTINAHKLPPIRVNAIDNENKSYQHIVQQAE